MFTLGSITEVESAEYELRHPKTLAGLGMVVMLAGPSHDKRNAFEAARLERSQAAFRRTGVVELLGYEEQQQQAVERSIACVLGWRGADVEYSETAKREWLGDTRNAWAVRQIVEALNEQARFISDSATG